MKRYDEDVIYPENREEYYAGMVEEPKGNWVKYEEASELLTEFAKAIIRNASFTNGVLYCDFCSDNIFDSEHRRDCIVLKAEQYLKGVDSEQQDN